MTYNLYIQQAEGSSREWMSCDVTGVKMKLILAPWTPLSRQGTQVAGQVPSCSSRDQKTQMRSIWILRMSAIAYLYWIVQRDAKRNKCACLLMHGFPSAMLLPLLPAQWHTSHLLLLTSLKTSAFLWRLLAFLDHGPPSHSYCLCSVQSNTSSYSTPIQTGSMPVVWTSSTQCLEHFFK